MRHLKTAWRKSFGDKDLQLVWDELTTFGKIIAFPLALVVNTVVFLVALPVSMMFKEDA